LIRRLLIGVTLATLMVGLLVSGAYWLAGRTDREARRFLPEVDASQAEPTVRAILARTRQEVEKTPRRAEAWGRYGQTLLIHNLLAPATRCFEQALALSPGDLRWNHLLGICLRVQDPARAADCFRRAAALDPMAPDPPAALAELLLAENRVAEARTILEGVRERIGVVVPRIEFHLARAEAQSGSSAAALERIRALSGRRPPRADVFQFLVREAAGAGLEAEANRCQRLLELLPKDMMSREWPDAIYETCRPFDRRLDTLRRKIFDELGANRPDAAMGWYDLCDPSDRVRPEVIAARATIELEKGDSARAQTMIEEALRTHPDDGELRIALVRVALARRRPEEAASLLAAAAQVNPEDDELRFQLGRTLVSLGREPDAEKSLRECVTMNPAHVEARVLLAKLRRKNGGEAEAKALLADAELLEPDHPLFRTGTRGR
jgi:tetratricopeptide (TPR) repeat protein